MPQLSFSFALPTIFSADNFFISDCNRVAYQTVMKPENWQSHALYLYGEKGSGKSHLANIWARENAAEIISKSDIKPEAINKNCVMEDVETCSDEAALFHLFNHCKDIGVKLLLTSSYEPSALPFKLPDLTSRLRSCALASINPPDDRLLALVMRKQFSDKQLLVDDEVVDYLTPRIERSFASIKNLVEKIDTHALAERKNISIPFVRKLLESQQS